MTLFTALLFVVLSPGVLLTIPAKGSHLVVALVHGLIFALLYHLTHKAVSHWIHGPTKEGFGNKTKKALVGFGKVLQAGAAISTGGA